MMPVSAAFITQIFVSTFFTAPSTISLSVPSQVKYSNTSIVSISSSKTSVPAAISSHSSSFNTREASVVANSNISTSSGFSSSSFSSIIVGSTSSLNGPTPILSQGSGSITPALVTSTLASAPSNFSIETTTNTAWLGNTWLTTELNGWPTIVPVIVGCPKCGGTHGGILLWNLPDITNVKFQFPDFPTLPGFYLPCVKIFGIQLSGNCFTPPVDDSKESPPPENYTPQSQLKPSLSQSSEASLSLSTVSSTVSSISCSSLTLSDCSVACSAISTIGGTRISCYSTTCYNTVTACSTAGITTTSIAPPATTTGSSSRYLIYTTDGASQRQISDLASVLSSNLGVGNVTQIALGVNESVFITAMNLSMVAYLEGNPTISSIELDSAGFSNYGIASTQIASPYVQNGEFKSRYIKRAGTTQNGARPELRFVSQPKGTSVMNTEDYISVEGGGQDVTVYVLDSGANTANSEFYDMPGSKRFLMTEKTPFPLQRTETDETGHGSCVISKVSGPNYGVAKNVNMVVAKYSIDPGTGKIWKASTLELLFLIYEEVLAKSTQGKAVINLSFGGTKEPLGARFIKSLCGIIGLLLENDVVVVVASGNDRGRSDVVDTYPALLRKKLTDMIVVGSVDLNGLRSYFSQGGSFLDVSAPGEDIRCASNRFDGWEIGAGTSLATAAVSGLAACFLHSNSNLQGRGLVAKNVKDYIGSLAWSRDGESLALWNGQSSPVISCNKMKTSAPQGKREAVACPTSISNLSSLLTSGLYSVLTTVTRSLLSTGSVDSSSSALSSVPSTTKSSIMVLPLLSTHSLVSINVIHSALTTVPSSNSNSLRSSIGKSSPRPSSTQLPTNQPPMSTHLAALYATGRCNVHVWQGLGQEGRSQVYIEVNITDASGEPIGYEHVGMNWGSTLSIKSKLDNDMIVSPQTGVANKNIRRVADPLGGSLPPPLFEHGPVKFAIGANSWDTTSSSCSVGSWDNGNAKDFFDSLIFGNTYLPNRQIDCKFDC